ncbi:MAG: sodium/solute symporter [Sediminibacterium sp.]
MDHIKIGGIDAFVIILYISFLVLIGIFISKKKNKAGKLDSEDLFLSGRSLPWYKVGLSIFSTNVSPSMLVAYFGAAYTSGIVLANFEWMAWFFLLLLAFLFIPRYLSNNISTMPEFLLKRFGKKSHIFFTYFSMFSSLIIWSSFMLCIGGIVISQLTGIPVYISAIVIVIISLSYSVNGGLNSIVHTGMIQSIVLLFISAAIFFLGLYKIGSIDKLVTAVPKDYWVLFKPTTDASYPWHAIVLGYPVIGVWFWCTEQSIVQRTLAAKNITEGQKGALLVAGLKIIMPFIFIVPGIMCFVLVKDQQIPALPNPDHAYIAMVYGLLPNGVIGLALGTLLVSIVNDVATGLNSFSTVFSMDLYAKKINPNATPEAVRKMSKKVMVVAAMVATIIAILLSLTNKGLFDLGQSLATYLAPPITTVFVIGILWKRATPKAAELTLYFGTFFCLVIGFCQLIDFPSKHTWPHFMLLCFYMMVVLMVFMVVVSYLTNHNDYKVQLISPKEANNITNTKTAMSIKLMWVAIAVIMFIIYIIFK